MTLDLTEKDIEVVGKGAEIEHVTEKSEMERFENVIKTIERIVTVAEKFSVNLREQQAQTAQTRLTPPKNNANGVSVPVPQQQQQAVTVQQHNVKQEVGNLANEITMESLKDYFKTPDDVINATAKILNVFPDTLNVGQALKLMQDNLGVFSGYKIPEAKEQFKLMQPMIRVHLRQYFPDKEVKKKNDKSKNISK